MKQVHKGSCRGVTRISMKEGGKLNVILEVLMVRQDALCFGGGLLGGKWRRVSVVMAELRLDSSNLSRSILLCNPNNSRLGQVCGVSVGFYGQTKEDGEAFAKDSSERESELLFTVNCVAFTSPFTLLDGWVILDRKVVSCGKLDGFA